MSSSDSIAFTPRIPSGAVNLTVGTGGADRVALPANSPSQVLVTVTSGSVVFLEFGKDNTVVASASTSMAIQGAQVFTVPIAASYVAAVVASGTAAINIAPGAGV